MTTIYAAVPYNAATTKTSRTAIEAMLPYLDKMLRQPVEPCCIPSEGCGGRAEKGARRGG